jgi:hypothetical protein
MPPRVASAPAAGRLLTKPTTSGGAGGGGVKMAKKPVKLSLFQTIRATAGAKQADRNQRQVARSAGEIQAELGVGRDLNIFHAAQVGSFALLRAVLDAGQPVNATDETKRTALHHAGTVQCWPVSMRF